MPSPGIGRLAVQSLGLAILAAGLLASRPARADDVKIGLLFGVTGEASSAVPPLLDAAKKSDTLQAVLADTKGQRREQQAREQLGLFLADPRSWWRKAKNLLYLIGALPAHVISTVLQLSYCQLAES